jgi:CRISPR-associated protein (TIGR02710 family)
MSQTELPDLDKLTTEWKNMDRTTPDGSKEALAFYDEHIFPLVKEAFINKSDNRPDKEYEGLILPVGFSPEPLILSILAIKPKRVGLLYTPETEKLLPRIQDETALTLDQLDTREIDGSSTVAVYEVIMELYEKWGRPANIAVDITGGKKSMVGGAAMAGAALGADIYYVDNTSFTLGKPEPGSEYLSRLDNPYTVFGDLEAEKAKDLYNRHDYAGAQRIFNQLEGQVGDANKAKVYEAYGLLCATYEAWDNLEIGKAKNFLNRLLDLLKHFPRLGGLVPLHNLEPILVEQERALECLLPIDKDEKHAQKHALSIPDGFHFAFMLYHNALRREEQGKLDMACLILYRLLEWIEQHRLAQYCIDTSNPNYSKSGRKVADLFNKYSKKKQEIYGPMDKLALPNPIALVDGFLVLHALDDPVVKGLNWRAFRGQVEMRNLSVYAHGMNKINERSFRAFKSTVEERFCKAQEIAGIDVDTFSEQHEFIVP